MPQTLNSEEIEMEITGRILEKNARTFLDTLEFITLKSQQPMNFPEYLVKLGEWRESLVRGTMVYIRERPSEEGTKAITISYISEGGGVLMEIKSNSDLEYSSLFVKSKHSLQGYIPFPEQVSEDKFGNSGEFEDKCLDSEELMENYCGARQGYLEGLEVAKVTIYKCPNGCSNGACI